MFRVRMIRHFKRKLNPKPLVNKTVLMDKINCIIQHYWHNRKCYKKKFFVFITYDRFSKFKKNSTESTISLVNR